MIKIVVIGPESTGKSELCTQLAAHFKTNWVKEYAREYLEASGGAYSFDDLVIIAAGQAAAEDKASRAVTKDSNEPDVLIIDTDLYVLKIWSEFVYNRCDNLILKGIASGNYDMYLLCNIDLPWVKDEFREQPELIQRQKLFCMYKDAMVNQHVPWVLVSGVGAARTLTAITAVEDLLRETPLTPRPKRTI